MMSLPVAVEMIAQREEAERGERRRILLRTLPVVQPVGGELFANELVVRQIVVERLDDVVAIGPGVGIERSLLASPVELPLGVGVARHIEPVTAPAFAVVRRREQSSPRPFRRRSESCRRGTRSPAPASAAGRSGRSRRAG